MRPVQFPAEKIVGLFRESKVLTKEEVLDACGCKSMTFWKAMKSYGYLTSYNHNAMYYTLHDIPAFDAYGLWTYRGIRFSRWGSLPKTIVQVVEASPAGYTARELSERLEVALGPEMSRLHRLGRIHREKIGLTLVYLASEEEVRGHQVVERQEQRQRLLDEASLPIPEVIIAVLVELVRHPGTTARALARRLRRRRIPVTEKDVLSIFTHYDLKKKPPRLA